MKPSISFGTIVLALLATTQFGGCAEPVPEIKGDAVRGETVHKVCLDCHGTGLYTSAERKIKSLPALRREVARWGDYYSPAFTPQDNEDVVVYLNSAYYKFP